MIPDIVIDYQDQLYVMDSKYRIPVNLPMALGEMHKYRDGILARGDDSTVVKEVYILTSTECYMPSDKDFYDDRFMRGIRWGRFVFRQGKIQRYLRNGFNRYFILEEIVNHLNNW